MTIKKFFEENSEVICYLMILIILVIFVFFLVRLKEGVGSNQIEPRCEELCKSYDYELSHIESRMYRNGMCYCITEVGEIKPFVIQ